MQDCLDALQRAQEALTPAQLQEATGAEFSFRSLSHGETLYASIVGLHSAQYIKSLQNLTYLKTSEYSMMLYDRSRLWAGLTAAGSAGQQPESGSRRGHLPLQGEKCPI